MKPTNFSAEGTKKARKQKDSETTTYRQHFVDQQGKLNAFNH